MTKKKKVKEYQSFLLKKKDKFAIFIGPVGGWSPKDKSYFKSLEINKIKLAKNTLKADTAAIVCLSGLRGIIDE